MDVKVLDKFNIVSLSANYSYDPNVTLLTNTRDSYNGVDFTLDNCLSSIKDTTINKYTSFYLTDGTSYNDYLTLDQLKLPSEYIFTSYIQSSNGFYLSAVENLTSPVTDVRFVNEFTNDTFFEIVFLNNKQCKIIHTDGIISRYLTYDYINSKFIMLTGNNSIGFADLNTFEYNYDSSNRTIIFYKNIYDKINILSHNLTNNELIFEPVDNTVKTILPYTPKQIFYLRINNSTNNITLSTSNYVYTQNLDSTKLIVDVNKSTYNFDTNFVINNEYYTIEPYKSNNLYVNILNLKNQKTPYNTQSYGGIFDNEPRFKHRYYESLFTGVKQETGNSNIQLGYSSYTSTKFLKSDNINYFHIPYDIYPYSRININDTKLNLTGAIASDTPYYSDKVFKKLNNYKYSSPFGDVSDTQTNSYLCTWLSGNSDINDKGIWIDRYYDPSNISYYNALTNPSTGVITDFDTIVSKTNNDNTKSDIFDTTSSLSFEPGAFYAYHRIGTENCKSFVTNLSSNLVYNNFDCYFSKTYAFNEYKNEINFESNNFVKINPINLNNNFNNFTINFDINLENIDKPIGSQIFGNYSHSGFGIFNYRKITPYSITFNDKNIFIFNTSGRLLRTITTDNEIVNILKFEPNNLFLVFDNNGYVTKYTYNGTAIDKNYISELNTTNPVGFYSFGEYGFFTINGNWYRIDINTLTYDNGNTLDYNTTKVGGDGLNGILVNEQNVYLLSGVNVKLYNNELHFVNSEGIYTYDIDTTELNLRISSETIQDYTFDKLSNLFFLFDYDKIGSINNSNEDLTTFALSSFTEFDNIYGKSIDLIDEFYNNEHITDRLSIFSLSSNSVDSIPVYTSLKTDFSDYNTTIIGGYILPITSFSNNWNINNYDYLRNNYDDGETITVKIKLPNIYDVQTYETGTLTYPLSNFAPRNYYNISITFDTVLGTFILYVNGKMVDSYSFDPGKYSYGSIYNNPIYIGTEYGNGNEKINDDLNDVNYYNYGNFKMKDLYIYNTNLYIYEIANIIRSKYNIDDLMFEMPTGKRGYIETIDTFFKNKLPGRKSNMINIGIKDTGITQNDLQDDINREIILKIKKALPATVMLNSINWEQSND